MYTLSVYIAYLSVAMLLANSEMAPGLADYDSSPRPIHTHHAAPQDRHTDVVSLHPIQVLGWDQIVPVREASLSVRDKKAQAETATPAPNQNNSANGWGEDRSVTNRLSIGLDKSGQGNKAAPLPSRRG